jgi:hypothetical protein
MSSSHGGWIDDAVAVLRQLDREPTPVADEAVVLAIAEVWQRWHVPPDWEAGELARVLVQRDSARGRVRVLEQSLAQTKAWLDNSEELRGRAEEERDRARGLAAQLEEEAHREHRSGQHRAGR